MALLKISETVVIFMYSKISQKIWEKVEVFTFEPWHYIAQICGFFFLLISSLIHNEIIIINHPKLKSKTEYYLDKDADKEQCSSFYSDTFLSDSKDSSINSNTNLFSDLT